MKLDRKRAMATLSAAQTAQLLAAVLQDNEITWTVGRFTWTISPKGANAVLLKMDEPQRRRGTPGPLVRNGNKPETVALPRCRYWNFPQPR